MSFSRDWKDGPLATAPYVSIGFDCLAFVELPYVLVVSIMHPCAAAGAYDLGTGREQEYTS